VRANLWVIRVLFDEPDSSAFGDGLFFVEQSVERLSIHGSERLFELFPPYKKKKEDLFLHPFIYNERNVCLVVRCLFIDRTIPGWAWRLPSVWPACVL